MKNMLKEYFGNDYSNDQLLDRNRMKLPLVML